MGNERPGGDGLPPHAEGRVSVWRGLGATPSFVVGVTQTEPDGVVMYYPPTMSVPDLRRLLRYCLSELDSTEPPELS